MQHWRLPDLFAVCFGKFVLTEFSFTQQVPRVWYCWPFNSHMAIYFLQKRKVKYTVTKDETIKYICHDNCLDNFKQENADNYFLNWEGEIRVKDLTSNKETTPKPAYERKCVVCKKKTDDEENNLTWEIMDFCNEFCLCAYFFQQFLKLTQTRCPRENCNELLTGFSSYAVTILTV